MSLPLHKLGLAAALALGGPGAALAHPHIFIDTGLRFAFDGQGRVTAVEITWVYDTLYSLSQITERGLDADADGRLTQDEAAALSGFDLQWDPGFAGDSYALLGAAPLSLSPPRDGSADYENGQIRSRHWRDLASPLALTDEPLILQVYDPSYYTAYKISFAPGLDGAPEGCSAQIYEPDRAAADAQLEAALAEYAGDASGAEADFPAVGAAYADEVRLTCPGG